jgi:putative redox protein
MNNEISITWKDGLAFEAESEGHHLILDSAEDKGGRNLGVRPKPLMLIALAGCTGMDVVSILQKMRVKLDHFKLKVDGTESEETPKRYTKMHIIYEFWGEDLSYEKLEKAINLSARPRPASPRRNGRPQAFRPYKVRRLWIPRRESMTFAEKHIRQCFLQV